MLLDEIADTILPDTKTPGAKAAGVGPFIAMMVADTYDPREQAVFRDGLEALERESRMQNGGGFMASSPAQRLALLSGWTAKRSSTCAEPAARSAPHYFRMIKELTLLGYFTSEIGCTQAMRYVETPGRFEPCHHLHGRRQSVGAARLRAVPRHENPRLEGDSRAAARRPLASCVRKENAAGCGATGGAN